MPVKSRHDIESQVRQHRQLAGMTQQGLASRLGVTRQTVLSIEKGKYTPSVALALRLGQVFGVSVEALFQLRKGEGDDDDKRG